MHECQHLVSYRTLVPTQLPTERTQDKNFPEIARIFDHHLDKVIGNKESSGQYKLQQPQSQSQSPAHCLEAFSSVNIAKTVVNIFGSALWKLTLRDSYTDEFIPLFCNYTFAMFAAQTKLRQQLPVLLPITAMFCSELHQARVHLHEVTQLLSPAFRQARAKVHMEDDRDKGPINWLLRNAGGDQASDDRYLTKILLAYGIAFVFSASQTGAQLVTEAAFQPSFCDLIREEAMRTGELTFDKASIQRLSILDSFCKETHKHHPSAACM